MVANILRIRFFFYCLHVHQSGCKALCIPPNISGYLIKKKFGYKGSEHCRKNTNLRQRFSANFSALFSIFITRMKHKKNILLLSFISISDSFVDNLQQETQGATSLTRITFVITLISQQQGLKPRTTIQSNTKNGITIYSINLFISADYNPLTIC